MVCSVDGLFRALANLTRQVYRREISSRALVDANGCVWIRWKLVDAAQFDACPVRAVQPCQAVLGCTASGSKLSVPV